MDTSRSATKLGKYKKKFHEVNDQFFSLTLLYIYNI